MFETIINAIEKTYADYLENAVKLIQENDNYLRNGSTSTRWDQFISGKITREKAAEYAINRACKEYEKSKEKHIAETRKIAEASEINEMTVSVVWKKSSVWGYNPHATVTIFTNAGYMEATGKASGCGYDKRSAAVAEALNQLLPARKIIYKLKEDNNTCYGMGKTNCYPYYEGGVGIDCLHEIMKLAGYKKVSDHGTRTTDFYHYVKEN